MADVAVIQIELSQEEMCQLMQEREWWNYCPKKKEEGDDENESGDDTVEGELEPPLKMML